VKHTDLDLLTECHRERLTLRQRHVAVARFVTDYEFNNAYQYVISREDVHLAWLEAAIGDLGGKPADAAEPALQKPGKRESFLPFVQQDAKDLDTFVAKWRPRAGDIVNARHRSMIGVLLGETLEQKRFFDQIVGGQDDLLGRRANGPASPGTGDGVLPVRWIE
jgi:hypothetical protein